MIGLRNMLIAGGVLLVGSINSTGAERLNVAPKPVVADKVADRYESSGFNRTTLGGLLGERMKANLEQRLLRDVDEDLLLAGFKKRPGSHPWIGEHVGKYLDAACHAWAYSGSDPLKAKIDRMVRELVAAQKDDGYLGTYTDDERWTSWDVWVHKYCLIGLLTYYRMTGDPSSLEAARRVGDLLDRTFGDEPGKRDIIRSGTHVGMAATSVLEPMAALYRYAGEQRDLDFCRYLTRAYDQPHGPKIIATLLDTKDVHKTANNKAYEMLSNLVGLCDLYRLTGDRRFVDPPLIAWEDIVKNRLYITGSPSSGEHFRDNHDLPAGPDAHVGEACVTVTWMQLNLQLLRLFGEPRFAEELERTVYNHLLGAQHPTEGHFCYFTPLYGKKPYQGRKSISCCQSSGPRGVSLIPQMVWGRLDDGVVVWLYSSGRTTIDLPDGNTVELVSTTDFPVSGRVEFTVSPKRQAEFPISLRVPEWCNHFEARAGSERFVGHRGELLQIRRQWKEGDRIDVEMDMTVKVLNGGKSYPGFAAVRRGPEVLAIDSAVNPDLRSVRLAGLASTDSDELGLQPVPQSGLPDRWGGDELFEINGLVATRTQPIQRRIRVVPFSAAGRQGTLFGVWLPTPDNLPAGGTALTAFGHERWSRRGNVDGSICDQMLDTFRVTYDGKPADLDWYEVEMDQPAEVRRVVFAHGRVFHDGGWFDTSKEKPQIQVRREPGGDWETVATLESYPHADASHAPRLRDGHTFEVRLPKPVTAIAVRIVGRPSSGDNPNQAFSSCAELQAHSE